MMVGKEVEATIEPEIGAVGQKPPACCTSPAAPGVAKLKLLGNPPDVELPCSSMRVATA